jgi:hypothetical protein
MADSRGVFLFCWFGSTYSPIRQCPDTAKGCGFTKKVLMGLYGYIPGIRSVAMIISQM